MAKQNKNYSEVVDQKILESEVVLKELKGPRISKIRIPVLKSSFVKRFLVVEDGQICITEDRERRPLIDCDFTIKCCVMDELQLLVQTARDSAEH